MGIAVEQWCAVGGHLLDFARRMEHAVLVQEDTWRRLYDLLDRRDLKTAG